MPVKDGPVANGTADPPSNERMFRFDPDDPEYIKDLQRPAVIKEDLNEMERRKRVHEILGDSFRSQLEKVVVINEREKQVLADVNGQAGQPREHSPDIKLKLSEIISPRGQIAVAHLHGISHHSITPIFDQRGDQSVSKAEKIARCKLASLYRLVDLFQWSQNIHNHITLRPSADKEQVLVNPFGLLYHEVTSSSLVTVNLPDGHIEHAGSTGSGVSEGTLRLHLRIHQARPDCVCVMHLQTPTVNAVASMKTGLLPMCQEALAVGPLSYHTLAGSLDEDDEQQAIIADLGADNKIVIVRPLGAFLCAATIAEAFNLAQNLTVACETQVILVRGDGFFVLGDSAEETLFNARMLINACEQQVAAARAGLDNLVVPEQSVLKRAAAAARRVQLSPAKHAQSSGAVQWHTGELEWEAWMRVLDNAGFKTGHQYRLSSMRPSTSTAGLAAAAGSSALRASDVQTPPAASGTGELDELDNEAAARLAALRREHDRVRWLNSPNCYQKVEFLESGTDHPKKITKWVPEEAAAAGAHGTPIKITDAHQFSPLSLNPKEFREKQRAIKENRRAGGISAGPQSHVLDAGLTPEEMARLNQNEVTADRVVMIGTASKGIIERDFRHNAQVYKQLYAPNPFAGETDEDIQRYMSSIRAKSAEPAAVMTQSAPAPDEVAGSPVDTPGADTVSLMQAARDHRPYEDEPQHFQPAAVPESSAAAAAAAPVPSGASPQLPVAGVPYAKALRWTHETTFDAASASAAPVTVTRQQQQRPAAASSQHGRFARSRSERQYRRTAAPGGAASHVNGSGDTQQPHSDDEAVQKKEKKKKRGFFSFGRKKSKAPPSSDV